MHFIAVNELKSPRLLRERLRQEHELLLTNSGKPMAIIINLELGDDPEATMRAVRSARSAAALRRIREAARKAGTDKMSLSEINQLIKQTRAERSRKS